MTCNLAINSLLFMICTLSLQFKHWAESALNLCLFSMWLFRSVLVLNLSSQTWQQISLSLLALSRLSFFLFKSIFSSFNYLDSVSFFSIVFSLVAKSKSFCLFAVFKFFIISSRSLSLFVNLSFSSSVLSLWLKGHKSFAKNLHLFLNLQGFGCLFRHPFCHKYHFHRHLGNDAFCILIWTCRNLYHYTSISQYYFWNLKCFESSLFLRQFVVFTSDANKQLIRSCWAENWVWIEMFQFKWIIYSIPKGIKMIFHNVDKTHDSIP